MLIIIFKENNCRTHLLSAKVEAWFEKRRQDNPTYPAQVRSFFSHYPQGGSTLNENFIHKNLAKFVFRCQKSFQNIQYLSLAVCSTTDAVASATSNEATLLVSYLLFVLQYLL